MEIGDKIKLDDCIAGNFILAGHDIFEVVRSGDVYKESMSPDTVIMQMYKRLPSTSKGRYEKGQLVEDYFNCNFIYLKDKMTADSFISKIESK